jgi:hypothetical protein
MKPTKVKKSFSKFTYTEAFRQLGVTRLNAWPLVVEPMQLSDFFQERFRRLQRAFDLRSYEESKKLIIDAICEEAIITFDTLKIWKGAALESDTLTGNVDYLIAENKAYLEAPLMCVIEAKKDDFEQGLAQCLVEMQACQWQNRQINHLTDVFGIVTNGQGWQFYRLNQTGAIDETLLYGISDLEMILAVTKHLFSLCQNSLQDAQSLP